jgi:glutamyl-tRNA synthetase
MTRKIRVRFAPSPTGGLHLGGVRTVLYNYLFAQQNRGDFIVRIEDTDQSRYVPGAEQYIFDCLAWAGLTPHESPLHPADHGPYRQSERKTAGIYQQYAQQLVAAGHAYYAFDTPEELDQMRENYKTTTNPSPQYNQAVRVKMRNALSLPPEEVKQLIETGCPYVVRIKMPDNETIAFTDIIRGKVVFNTQVLDDKVLLKADGMPTYHLAVVVDDYLMKITHAFRGEEWLPSAPLHVLLWTYLFGVDNMPQWAHLPLILGPNGKLSKRDGATYGFPVFAMNWTDPQTNELVEGFKEKGFLPEAFINFLALLGWNDGSDQEIFTQEELIQKFSIERVHSSGAQFDYEKAKWFNHEWIKKLPAKRLLVDVKKILASQDLVAASDEWLEKIIALVKDRCTLLTDFVPHTSFFFDTPTTFDTQSIKAKWNDDKKNYFLALATSLQNLSTWEAANIEYSFKQLATEKNIKPGDLQLPFRVMLVGGKFGPPVFDIAALLGKENTLQRIEKLMKLLS